MHSSVFLGVSGAVLSAVAFGLYLRQMRRGISRPNPVTWAMWSVLISLGAVSFFRAGQSFSVALQFFTGAVGCIATFLYASVAGKRAPFSKHDFGYMAGGVVALFVWFFRGAGTANALLSVVSAVAFIPTWRGLLVNPRQEMPVAWWLWTGAYGTTLLNVLIHEPADTAVYLSPVLGVVGHGVTAFLAGRRTGDAVSSLAGDGVCAPTDTSLQ
jgi:hypothetical protein